MNVPNDSTVPEGGTVPEPAPDAIPVSSDVPVTPDTPVTPVEVYDVQVVPDSPPGPGEASAGAAAGGEGTAPPPRKRRRLKWLWVTLLSLLIAGLITLAVYMIVITNGWRDYSADLEGAVEDLKATAAEDRADLEATQARLDTVQTQLENANERITELANEEANAVDTRDVLRNYMEAMISCADERQGLIDVLRGRMVYRDTTPNVVERQLIEFCDSVKNDYNAYLAE